MRDGRHNIAQAALTGSAGLVVAVFTIIAAASYAALIFHGPLQPYTANGMWMGLVTAVTVGLLVAITSSCRGVIAIPQDRIAPILAILSANIVAAMPNATPDQICLVVVAVVVLVTLITGLFLYGLGLLKLGNLIRYIPYPVIGGFLAGSGWLLVCGGIRVMTGRAVTFKDLPCFFQNAILVQWVAGVVFGGLLFILLKRARHQLIMPATLVLGIAAFYIFLAVTGRSLADARQSGWLAEFPHTSGMRRITLFSAWPLVSWSLLFNHINLVAWINLNKFGQPRCLPIG